MAGPGARAAREFLAHRGCDRAAAQRYGCGFAPDAWDTLLTSAVDARFNDSLNRPSLAQSFRATSNLALFTPIVNHLKSKSCGGAAGADADQGDGQGCWNAARTSAAEALRDWANSDPTGTGSDNVLIIGDLNSYAMEDPIQTLVGGGLTDLEPAFGDPDAYSYVFFGQVGSLDHAMSTAALTPQVSGTVPWNINADEIPSLDYNTEFGVLPSFYAPTAYRSSDHDPIVVLESMKMEIPVGAPVAGKVKQILVAEGDPVQEGQDVAILEG